MKITVYIAVILMTLTVMRCDDNDNEGKRALAVNPRPVNAGDDMEITYDMDECDAGESPVLYATVNMRKPHSVLTKRYKMKKYGNMYEVNVFIDHDAYYVDVAVGTEEQVIGTSKFSSVVHKDGRAKRHGLAFMMYSCTEMEDIKYLFSKDEKLYPHARARLIPWWLYLAKTRSWDAIIKEEMRAQLKESNGDYDTRMIAYSACLVGYYYMKDYTHAMAAIRNIISQHRKERPLPTPMTNALANILQGMHEPKSIRTIDKNEQQIIIELVKFILKSGDVGLLTMVYRLRELSPRGVIARQLDNEENVKLVKDRVFRINHEQAIGAVELFNSFCNQLMEMRDYQSVVDIYKAHENAIADACKWVHADDNMVVTSYPAYGMESILKVQYGIASMRLGRISEGISIVKSLEGRRMRQEYVYAADSAYSILYKHHMRHGEVDSAEKYLAYLIILSAPSENRIYEKYRQEQKDGNKIKSKRQLVMDHPQVNLLISRPAPRVDIKSSDRIYNLGNSDNGTAVLIFSSQQCSVCELVVPDVLCHIAEKDRHVDVVYLFSDIPEETIKSTYECYSDQYTCKGLTHKAVQALSIAGFPTIVIIHNGKVIYQDIISIDKGSAIVDNKLNSIVAENGS